MKVWTTQYALTKNIYIIEGSIDEQGMFVVGDGTVYVDLYLPSECHQTKASAVRRAKAMREKKIASLRKQIARLKKLKFD